MPQYCLVTHRIETYVKDKLGTEQRNPDVIPANGTITFTPLLDTGDSVAITHIDGTVTTATIDTVEASITNGEIWHRGEPGIKLFAGGDDCNPERIRYRVKFTNVVADGGKIALKDIIFEATPGGELQLSTVQPTPSQPYPGFSPTMEAAISEISAARDSSINYALTQIDTAKNTAVEEVETSSAEVLGMAPRITALEAMGGLSPQSPMDGQTANLIEQPGTLTHAALAATRVDMSVGASKSTAPLGAELITSAGWSLGAGWSGDLATGFTHVAGDTSVLEWLNNLPAGDYQISFTVSADIPAVQNLNVTLGDSPAPYIYGLTRNIVTSVKQTSPGPLRFTPVTSSGWTGTITGISVREIVGTVPASMVWRDDQSQDAMRVRVGLASQQNFYVGDVAGQKNTSGVYNVAIGADSMGENTSGYWNTSVGWQAMRSNTSGTRNVALGMRALTGNTTGYRNVAVGQSSMVLNTTGRGNIAIGADSMLHNSTGNENVAIGLVALGSNVDGARNVAIGNAAMNAAKTSENVGIGYHALYASEATGNVGIGSQAARYTKAGGTTAIGASAGINVVSGADNTTIGFEAGRGRGYGQANFSRVTAIGKNAGRRLGDNHNENTLIGYAALANADGGVDNTVIGTDAGLSAVGDVLNRNVLIGKRAGAVLKTGGDENTIIGTQSGNTLTTGKQNVLIGYNVQASTPTASNEINIGNVIKASNVPGFFEVTINGKLRVANLPKQDPQSTNQVWNDNGTLKVSA